MAVDQVAGGGVDHDLLHPADGVQRGRQGAALAGRMEPEVQLVGFSSASETLSVPLPVIRLRQGVVVVLAWPCPFAYALEGDVVEVGRGVVRPLS